jgi:hypothetical protein
MDVNQNLIEVQKQIFVEALRGIPTRPAEQNRPLRDLVIRFRDHLGDCNDEIPLDLKRFGFPSPMTFSDFIYAVTGS